ncbi:Eukaryotic translation initiation factor 2 subunit 1 [Caenorhabditis elegans]|uniref:Eukaryotic translation initiation factor 2 subunit 1 n=1 Tax=Caenorhabditis elegans TaxID=6239 RepID=Q9BKU3_CAEEL|nr:Eukaryotic translation initiation factor 2 subunit 1 [Caenorhabditis elegans]CCD73431.1 Eukaryotic translation initiation factor 2 subunit 1 [Caenorhabditis elegans]|eukprot:NP_490930.1 Eukaryotic Initiation Factor [Caenorhabditis elegans]
MKCRFYENQFPDVEETVVANVKMIADMGAYVRLSEYNDKEGMILLSELSRRRIRSVNKLIRVGRSESVVVIRVDKDKGYIDLSKRRVYQKDLKQCDERFANAKMVNSILRHVAEQVGYTTDEELEDLYQKTAWHFDRKEKRKAASYDAFKKAITEPTILDECDISADIKEKLLEDIRKKLTPQAVKIRADIEVSCFDYDGIDAVKAALIAGKNCSNGTFPIKINLIAAPHFVVTTQTLDREGGIEAVNSILDTIKNAIEGFKGKFTIKEEARIVTDIDDEKKKGDGDEDEEESEEDEDEEEDEDDDGLMAPKGLDQQVDAEEASRDNRKKAGDDEDSDEEDD